jgi:hypothetical protein
MENIKFSATKESEHCIRIKINEEVDIENLEITLINDVRIPISTSTIESRDFSICCNSGKPTFARILETVKYVEGSGYEHYRDIAKELSKENFL